MVGSFPCCHMTPEPSDRAVALYDHLICVGRYVLAFAVHQLTSDFSTVL
jgi:hypothetical protein